MQQDERNRGTDSDIALSLSLVAHANQILTFGEAFGHADVHGVNQRTERTAFMALENFVASMALK